MSKGNKTTRGCFATIGFGSTARAGSGYVDTNGDAHLNLHFRFPPLASDITRAQEQLYLTHATTRNLFGATNWNSPSQPGQAYLETQVPIPNPTCVTVNAASSKAGRSKAGSRRNGSVRTNVQPT